MRRCIEILGACVVLGAALAQGVPAGPLPARESVPEAGIGTFGAPPPESRRDAGAPRLPKGILAVEGRTATPFALANSDGETHALTPRPGAWLMLHFWASWCGPCRRELPALERAAPAIEAAGMRLVLVNTAEDEDTLFGFLAGIAPDLDSLLDTDGLVTEAWQPRGLPATYFIDPLGRVRYQALGGQPWDEPAYLGFIRRLTGRSP